MATEKNPFISIRDISIRLAEKIAFSHTSWTIHQGENWAIVGQTGSGKTLFANVINRRLPIVGGEIIYFFDTVSEGRPYIHHREILTLSAETQRAFLRPYALYHQARWHSFEGEDAPVVSDLLMAESIEHHSPFETTPMQTDKAIYDQRRDWVIRLFHLEYLLGRRIIHLSHGESRKVLFARLLMQGPRLLILDNPYSGLDQESREIMKQAISSLLKKESQDNPQILFISPLAEDIPQDIDNLLVLDQLKIVDQGKKHDVLKRLGNSWHKNQMVQSDQPVYEDSGTFLSLIDQYCDHLAHNPFHKNGSVVFMKNIQVTYDGSVILDHVNWEVKSGERWVLSGHNGAGKSTLLSLILADNPMAYANDISVFGQKRGCGESIWEIKQNIGWISPELHIFYQEDSTCLEVVSSGFFDSVGLHRHCSSEQTQTAGRWLDAFGLAALAYTPFFTLSAGQQRMVLLARSIVKYPPLLVLDEPCQGLDEEHRQSFIGLLNTICRRTSLTLIYITHQQEEIPTVITHRLVLDHGKAVINGSV